MGLFWLLILVGLGALAYFAVKGRMIRMREELERAMRRTTQGRRANLPSEDMIKCPTCGTYSAPGQTKNCGKPGCPYN